MFSSPQIRTGFANNALIFPGVGAGAVAVAAPRITAGLFVAAARALAEQARHFFF